MIDDENYKKRKHQREDSSVTFQVSSGESSIKGTMVNYSAGGGALVFSARLGKKLQQFDIGQDVNLSSKKNVVISASIARNYDNGFAVKFTNTENVMELLNSIVSDKQD